MALSDDLAVARTMVHQRHGTPETLDHMLRLLTELVDTFAGVEAAMRSNVHRQYNQGSADGMKAVTLLVRAAVANVEQRQGELMAEHAAYAAADDWDGICLCNCHDDDCACLSCRHPDLTT